MTERFAGVSAAGLKRFPFKHIVIDEFLPAPDHAALRDRLDALVRLGTTDGHDLDRLSKIPGYDCYAWLFPADAAAPLDIFVGREFRDYAAGLFDIRLSAEVSAQFNHHPPGARNGRWHTDHTVTYHTAHRGHADSVNVWRFGCNLLNGAVPAGSDAQVVARVRAVAFLYYLGGDETTKDGGATELGYHGPASADVSLFTAVAPVANRLLMFECGPRSFHRAAGNRHKPRSLVVGWFHMTEEAAFERHRQAASRWCEDAVNGRFDFNEAPPPNHDDDVAAGA